MSNPGDTGEAIATAMRLGAQTALMDEAWWLPSPKTGRFGQSTLDQARQRPRTIYVDAAGRRFVNESNSYMEVGKAMYERDKTSRAVPCWLIFDDRYRKRYAHVRSHPGYFPKQMLESGRLKQAATLAELAELCGIDADGLAETVEHFNEHARNGRRPRLRPRRVRLQPVAGRSPPQGAPLPRPDRRGAVLRLRGAARRHRHLRRPRHRRARPRARPARPAHRGPLRHRQQHRHGHGPPLPRPGREHRQHDGVRLPRGAARRGRCREQPMADELAGKVAIVTGGGSGIGRATVERFVERGRAGRHRRHRRRGRRGAWPPRSATPPPSSRPTSPTPTRCRRSSTSPSSGSAGCT